MKEATFIRQNREKWERYENMASMFSHPKVEVLSEAYQDILADYSYARTQFSMSRICTYLNSISLRLHEKIYSPSRFSTKTILHLFTYEVPRLVVRNRKTFQFTTVLFTFFVIIGVIAQLLDINSFRNMVGDGYVDMTIRNIQAGKPCDVYSTGGEYTSFLAITWNNLNVGFKLFASGVIPFIGPLVFLYQNGVMLGEFQTIFFQYGAGFESMTSIWIHGCIEIPSILIEGTAAFTLSKGWIFPGSYTRKEAFKRSGKEAVKIFVTSLPVIVVAGFFEGFITRRTYDPLPVRLFIIFGLFSAWVYYYVVFPYKLWRQYGDLLDKVDMDD